MLIPVSVKMAEIPAIIPTREKSRSPATRNARQPSSRTQSSGAESFAQTSDVSSLVLPTKHELAG